MSKQLRYRDPEAMLAWAAEKIGIGRFRDDARAIGIEKNGVLVGVCVFDTWSTTDCHVHIASDQSKHWVSHEFLTHCFSFPFLQVGLQRVSAIVSETNKDALKFNAHLGFTTEGHHPMSGIDGSASISQGMLKTNCKWIPKE